MGNPSFSDQSKSVSLVKHGETVATQHNFKLNCEPMTTISLSKLEHLKDLADDDRMNESAWSTDRIFGSISGSAFFTSASGVLCYPQLPVYGKVLCLIGLIGGSILSICCFYRENVENKKRKKQRVKIVDKIDQIIESIDRDIS